MAVVIPMVIMANAENYLDQDLEPITTERRIE